MRRKGYLVHLLTLSGVFFAFLAATEICHSLPDPKRAFLWLAIAVLIDAVDGPLARRVQVKRSVPEIDGRTLDDIIDYLTFTFLPLLLVWRMNWLLPPAGLWVAAAMGASLLGFAHTGAKQESAGFFRGFPSYWNIFAFYTGLWAARYGPVGPTILLVILVILTVAPVRFLYPTLAPSPWRIPVLAGAAIWILFLVLLWKEYPESPAWLVWVSLLYPAFYVGLSQYLDAQDRRRLSGDGKEETQFLQ